MKDFFSPVREKFEPFLQEAIKGHKDNIHSVHLTGSAASEFDYVPTVSDINSVFVLNRMDMGFLKSLAPLGKKYSKKSIAAPRIMTPQYIETSLDVFPVEFLNIRLIHRTIMGDDIFSNIDIKPKDLRNQCERELKVRLMGLRQGYLSTLGNSSLLIDGLKREISNDIPLFRAIVYLCAQDEVLENLRVLDSLQEKSKINSAVFKSVYREKFDRKKLSITELNTMFENYYQELQKLSAFVDGFTCV